MRALLFAGESVSQGAVDESLGHLSHLRSNLDVFRSISTNPRIYLDLISEFASKQLVDGNLESSAFEIHIKILALVVDKDLSSYL